jgi:hypothetical protein
MRKLPLDISTFSELRTSNYLYVDKTQHMYNMITGGRRFFLSRPRRFGKSLLVSTLKEILTANKALFDNLWITQSDYEWKEYGVIHLDFSKLSAGSIAILESSLKHAITKIADSYDISLKSSSDQSVLLLEDLADALSKRFGRVAILIDEYDSPILKTLHDQELATTVRDHIQHFFTIIKSLDAEVQFVFITGVSSFAKAGLFSGINNLQLLTLQDKYATICGYTDEEIDHYFVDYMQTWSAKGTIPYDALRQQIKTWYNGYCFGENVTTVYNPFSLMNALHLQQFKNFWFESGTPTFLVEILKKGYTQFDPEKLTTTEESLGVFNIVNIPLIPLMFQAGYLTIVDYDTEMESYKLDFPNLEVKKSFQKYLLEAFAHINHRAADSLSRDLKAAFNDCNIEEITTLIKQLFAHVPYQLHIKQEKFYHALFMMICVGAGIKAQSEYSTSHGRIDLVIEVPKYIYVIEIKFNEPADIAFAQIEERRYYERFIAQDKPIILLGLSFKREPHNFDVTYILKKI